jgi:hypothetical protein
MDHRSRQSAAKSLIIAFRPMMRRLSILFCLAVSTAQAQDSLSIAEVLASAQKAPLAVAQGRIADRWRSTDAQLPLLDEASIRTQTRRFDIYQQSYQVRVGTNGLKERRAYRSVQAGEANIAQARGKEAEYEALYDAYAALVDYRAGAQRQTVLGQLLQVHKDRVQLIENAAVMGGKTDAEALMKAEIDRDGIVDEMQRLEMKTALIPLALGIVPPKPIALTGWIPTEYMIDELIFVQDTTQLVHPESAIGQARMDKIEAETQLERARSQQWLDFVQVGYTNRPGEPFRNDISVGAGINIPWNGSRTARMQLLGVERFAEKEEMAAKQQEALVAMANAMLDFASHQSKIEQIKQQTEVFEKRYNLKELANADQKGLEAVLLYKEHQLRQMLKVLEEEKEMTEAYIKCIYWSGKLGEKNWLGRE